eukprot:2279611-Amphidinium_carterae.1
MATILRSIEGAGQPGLVYGVLDYVPSKHGAIWVLALHLCFSVSRSWLLYPFPSPARQEHHSMKQAWGFICLPVSLYDKSVRLQEVAITTNGSRRQANHCAKVDSLRVQQHDEEPHGLTVPVTYESALLSCAFPRWVCCVVPRNSVSVEASSSLGNRNSECCVCNTRGRASAW